MRALVRILLCTLLVTGCAQTQRQELDTVARRIRSILEIPAYEYVYREIIYLGKEATFLGFRTQDQRLLFAVDMRVQAGVRLPDSLELRPAGLHGVEVRLPAPEILVVDADEESITQFFLLERGGAITHTEYYDEIEASKAAIIEDAIERGILRQAQENLESLITQLLTGIGYTGVVFSSAGTGGTP